ncbi:hypothetical protein ASPWEDRAFT_119504 [Aspergillus wentii DTO 134E9]|uniref:EGF-like calcium-binding domain-containing protein n=1 Tax=Aspergillus wentii DTO 134E9 TaxID=1073089 RepID=A0A1L9R8A9_ASPWE|nr:uncharacterized protein ASPWEDRAFT_119504 [Aspergillus wentii DTO 134E9]KAI9924998.1 hypothetical protein MW887_006405 [Aspergillus wentii]OJJ31165.1 hypothetical protein ASPWEDRAFT_119504 [Aspergillus wentii DTO 134E9]
MHTFHLVSLLLASASLAVSSIVPYKQCGTCNPLSGENHCDPSTSCISTGTQFHCACRAGYKASKHDFDANKQFRLEIPNYEFLVFTPEHTKCDVPCKNSYGAGPDLCAEVPIHKECAV